MEDIIRLHESDWLAIGWFTPDYRPLAERFAANLTEHGAPHHLFARDKNPSGWDTRQKPSVVLGAMDIYPGKTLVLMDVDCVINGDIAPVTDIVGDIGVSIKARQSRKGLAWQKQIIMVAGSRVTVWKPAAPARAFAEEWRQLCAKAKIGGDETWLAWTYLRLPEIATSQINPRYAGREIGSADLPDGTVIWHDAAHGKLSTNPLKAWAKRFERRFLRTGRTKASALEAIGSP